MSWQLSLRADRPVEGCEVGALAYLYQKKIVKKRSGSEGQETPTSPNPAQQLPPPNATEIDLRFRWLRGPEMPLCAYHECPIANDFSPIVWSSFARKEKSLVQCIDDSMKFRLGLGEEKSKHSAVFCSKECFMSAWKSSSADQNKERQQSNGAEAVEQSRAPNKGRPRSLSSVKELGVKQDGPSNSGETYYSDEEWVEVCTGKSFIPSSEDVGRRIRLECNVYSKADGSHIFGPRSIRLEPVLALTPQPPKRSLATVKGVASGGGYRFRVVSYNLLSEIYATQQMYPDCDVWSLSWSYRCNNLMREIRDTSSDIVCLQEVQADHYDKYVKPAMYEFGFDGIYKQKTRESMGVRGKVDGCAIFWRRSKFRLSENYSVEFNECARTFAQNVADSDENEREMLNRLLKDNVAQVIILEILHPNQSSNIRNRLNRNPNSNNMLTVANTHLYSNKDYPDVKLWQCLTLVRELEQLVLHRDLPLIICGDFNSVPSSAVYEFLSSRGVHENHEDLKCNGTSHLEILPLNSHEIAHDINLVSAYHYVMNEEPSYTNYTTNFKGVLDYIWCSSDHIRPLAVIPVIAEDVILKYGTALPNAQFSSDHILICADFQLGGNAASSSSSPPPPPMMGTQDNFPHLATQTNNQTPNKKNVRR